MSVKRGQAFPRFPGWSAPSDYWQPSLGYSLGVGPQYFLSLGLLGNCVLGYFGFLCAAEFTVPNLASFSPASHLSVADIAVDLLQSPTCLHVRIKASKMDLFRQGCHIHIGLGRAPLCAVQALLAYLSLRGNVPGPLFLLANGQPLSRSILTDWLRQIFSTAGIEGNFFQPQLAHWGSHGSSSQWYSGPPNSGSWMLA